MDIYRAQRQFRTLAEDIAGTSKTTNVWDHGSKGFIASVLQPAAGVGSCQLLLKGVTGATFSFNFPVNNGEPCCFPFKIFGASSNIGGVNRGIVGLY